MTTATDPSTQAPEITTDTAAAHTDDAAPATEREQVTCAYCGKPGHTEERCNKKRKDERTRGSNADTRRPASARTDTRREPEPRRQPSTDEPRRPASARTSEPGLSDLLAFLASNRTTNVVFGGPQVQQAELNPRAEQHAINTGHVLGIDESDPEQLVLIGGTGKPMTTLTRKGIERRVADVLAQRETNDGGHHGHGHDDAHTTTTVPAISAEDLERARTAGKDDLLTSLRLMKELCPSQTVVAPVVSAEPKERTVFVALRDNITNGGRSGGNAIVGDLTVKELLALNPSIVRDDDAKRAEKASRPWWIMAGIIGSAALLTFFLLWALNPSNDDVKSARDDAAFSQKVAAAAEAARLAAEAAPRTFPVTIETVEAGEVKAGIVRAGEVKAGDVTAEGEINVHNTVTRTSHTTRIVHETAPVAPTAPTGGAAAPTASGTCSGTYIEKDSKAVECFAGDVTGAATIVCGKSEYTQMVCQVNGDPRRCADARNWVLATCP